MSSRPKFNNLSTAVRYALTHTDIGTKSSLYRLLEVSCNYLTNEANVARSGDLSVVCSVRSKFRKEKGLKEDARTYETQHRRNMLNDDKMPRDRWNKVQELLENVAIEPLKELLELFHSIDQAKLAISTYVKTAEFVDVKCGCGS